MSQVRLMVAICFAIIIAFCTGPPQPSPPPSEAVYKGSKEYTPPQIYYQMLGIPSGVTVKAYIVEGANAVEILEWYKKELTRAGYEVAEDFMIQTISTPEGSFEWGALVARKGDEGLGIWAMSSMAEGKRFAYYYVAKGKLEQLQRKTAPSEKLPPSDVVRGEEPIQRYPNSVMLSYEKSEGFPTMILINYGTMDNAQKVAEWYKSQLKDWTIKEERSSTEKIALHLVKAQEEVGIIIYAPTSERGYTSISIHYGIYKLPSKDTASGNEPIQRYPGSVMLRYSSMTYMGVRLVTITYGTHDSVDKVASWYESYLTQNGWQVMMSSVEGGAKSLTCVKGNAMISLNISPKTGYTEVEMSYQGGT